MRLIIPFLATVLTLSGCTAFQVPTVQWGATQDEVRARLGDPHLVVTKETDGETWDENYLLIGGYTYDRRYPGIVTWVYYVNDDFRIPAPSLEVRFNETGTVSQWGFIDSVSKQPLPIRQNLGQADRERSRECDGTPRIVLEEVLRPGVTTTTDVQVALGTPHRTTEPRASEPLIWSYYVRKPSPLRRLATALEIDFGKPLFDDTGNKFVGIEDPGKVRLSYFEGYHGCPVL
jgi:hypothetical protein